MVLKSAGIVYSFFMEKITLTPPPPRFQTDLIFTRGLVDHPAFAAAILAWPKRGAIIADAAVAERYGLGIAKKLDKENLKYPVISFPGGEASKSREIKQVLEDELLKRKLGRDCLIIAVGGGVTTDLVGYLASTYMRGVPVVYIPTSLLAMVDAAIGGKTAVDTPFGKNLIGTFYHPKSIFIDVDFLKTLPQSEWQNGLGEILKYGLIANEALFARCEKDVLHWKEGEIIEKLILSSIQTKVGVVELDPDEKGYRRILNFGHTVGHALEHLSQFAIPHGEAVAIGCMAESYLSYKLGHLPLKVLDRILKLFRQFGFSIKLPKRFDKLRFFEAMALDKKAKNAVPRVVLIDQIGHCVPFDGEYCSIIKPREFEEMLDWMKNG